MNITYSIIIVTWNGLNHLKKFLPSAATTNYEKFEIIIADNASDDGTIDWINKNYPQCRTVRFNKNYGYAGGNNRAVKYATGDVLIFLNNDAEVQPGWLTYLSESFKQNQADIIQPKIRSYKNREYFEYAGAAGGMIDWMGYTFCRGRIFNNIEKDLGQYDENVPIFWASGAAFVIRKNVFENAGGFDEDFEFHMEEVDLCWRCHKLGAKIVYEPKSVVYHLGGGSLEMGNPRKSYYNYRNSLIMLTKNLDNYLLPKLFFRLILDGISGLRSFFTGNPKETWAIIKAHFAYYARLPSALRKRKRLKKLAGITSSGSIIYPRLIIVQAFLLGRKTYKELPGR